MRCTAPARANEQPDPLMLHHLHAAFPSASCPMAAFQSQFQIAIVSEL